MFKLTPLTAAILVIVSAQAMADDSVSTQDQVGTANVADVKQTLAPFSTATQQQLGEGNDAAAVQDTATSTIDQNQLGDYNAGYAEQLFEDGSTITQQQVGSFNTSHASQSIGAWAATKRCNNSKAPATSRSSIRTARTARPVKPSSSVTATRPTSNRSSCGIANNAVIIQYGTANYATAEQIGHMGGQINHQPGRRRQLRLRRPAQRRRRHRDHQPARRHATAPKSGKTGKSPARPPSTRSA